MIAPCPMRRGPVTPARSWTRSDAANGAPLEELEASLAAIESSDLNAFAFVDATEPAKRRASPTSRKPFGGVPAGIKELEPVTGWPATEGSLVFRNRIATTTSTVATRLLDDGGAVGVGLTTASEFGGLNVSVTKLNGVTHNPWQHGRSTGGSSAGQLGGRRGRPRHARDRR